MGALQETCKNAVVLLFGLLSTYLLVTSCQSEKPEYFGQKPISHAVWDSLLHQHVHGNKVNYQGFIADSALLNQYVSVVQKSHPSSIAWSEKEQLAYWINAYNAFTMQLVVRNYPLKSIKDLNPTLSVPLLRTVWTETTVTIQGIAYSLDDIEHNILRKQFNEPRIHFALNCASASCPALRNEAYTAEQLEIQLTEQGRRFLNDHLKNDLSQNPIRISHIFKWFENDFTKQQSLISFLNQYAQNPILPSAEVSYLPYDWSLNDTLLLKTAE